ncbi:MAG: hypothetical protein QM696_07805 [Steroidobacteraceae bacterium]
MSAKSTNALVEAAQVYVDIARLRRGPEDLPAIPSLLLATIVAYALVSLGFGALLPSQGGGGHPVLLLAVDTALMLVWVKLMLQVARKPERFLQTSMAVFGFQLVLAPLFASSMALFLRLREDPSWQVPVSILVVALGIWALIVNTRIFQSATQWPGPVCVVLVIAQALLTRGLLMAVFPGTLAGDAPLAG